MVKKLVWSGYWEKKGEMEITHYFCHARVKFLKFHFLSLSLSLLFTLKLFRSLSLSISLSHTHTHTHTHTHKRAHTQTFCLSFFTNELSLSICCLFIWYFNSLYRSCKLFRSSLKTCCVVSDRLLCAKFKLQCYDQTFHKRPTSFYLLPKSWTGQEFQSLNNRLFSGMVNW